MRFIGLVLVLAGAALMYFIGYQGLTIDQARTRLAQLFNIPGLAPPQPYVGAPAATMGAIGSAALKGAKS